MKKLFTSLLLLAVAYAHAGHSATPTVLVGEAPLVEEGGNTDVVSWDSLRVLIEGPYANVTSGITNLTDITEKLMIPDTYLETVQQLDLPFEDWKAWNGSRNTSEWDTEAIHTWINYYIRYHNTVIAFLGNDQANATSEEGQMATDNSTSVDHHNNLGVILQGADQASIDAFQAFHIALNDIMPISPFDQQLDNSTIFNSTDGANNVTGLEQLQTNHVLFETYAFFDLFFGEKGIFMKQAEVGEEAPQESTGVVEGAEIVQADQGFLQGESETPAEGTTEVSTGEIVEAPATDARTIFKNIHDRIVIYACVVMFNVLGFEPVAAAAPM